jgi:hypothetical protein
MKIKALSSLLLLSVVFASCLKSKDTSGLLTSQSSTPITEIADVSYNNLYGITTDISLEATPPTETVNIFTLKYQGGKNGPSSDIKVKVTATNSNLPAGTVALPTANFTIPAEITIPRSTDRTVPFPITINKTGLDLSNVYALTFKITQVSEGVISELAKELTVTFVIKNKYDGKYTMTGVLVDNAAATITAKSPANVELITTGSNSVYLHNSGTSSSSFLDLFPIISAGAESAYGSFTPEFIFDANNNVIDVVNAYGQPASNTRSAAIDPSGINKWDPATKTLKVKWFMYQPSAITGVRSTFDFTFTYTGPR